MPSPTTPNRKHRRSAIVKLLCPPLVRGGIVAGGREADRRGPAGPFLAGIVLFMAGLAAGGLAPSMLVLVLARGLQGLGAGAIPAVAYATIARAFPEALRPRLFAVLSTAW